MFLLRLLWAVVRGVSTRRADLVAENLALRQQLIVLHRKTKRPRLKTKDRIFWLWLARSWDGWRASPCCPDSRLTGGWVDGCPVSRATLRLDGRSGASCRAVACA